MAKRNPRLAPWIPPVESVEHQTPHDFGEVIALLRRIDAKLSVLVPIVRSDAVFGFESAKEDDDG